MGVASMTALPSTYNNVAPIIIVAPEATPPTTEATLLEQQEHTNKRKQRRRSNSKRRRGLSMIPVDLDATPPAKSAIPIPLAAAPEDKEDTEGAEKNEKGLTLRLLVACASDSEREEIIARYESLCQ